MTIRFRCTHCGQGLKAPARAAGTAVRCPRCKTTSPVPNIKLPGRGWTRPEGGEETSLVELALEASDASNITEEHRQHDDPAGPYLPRLAWKAGQSRSPRKSKALPRRDQESSGGQWRRTRQPLIAIEWSTVLPKVAGLLVLVGAIAYGAWAIDKYSNDTHRSHGRRLGMCSNCFATVGMSPFCPRCGAVLKNHPIWVVIAIIALPMVLFVILWLFHRRTF